MKRNIFYGGLLMFATTLLCACGTDPEIPQFESRTIGTDKVRKVATTELTDAGLTEGSDLRYNYMYSIGSDMYFRGKAYRGDVYGNYSIYKYNPEAGKVTVAWYVSDTNIPIEYAGMESPLSALTALVTQMQDLQGQMDAKDAEMQKIQNERETLRDELYQLDYSSDEYKRIEAAIAKYDEDYNTLYNDRDALKQQYDEKDSERSNLYQSVREIIDAVSNGMSSFSNDKNRMCTYNGKGYSYIETGYSSVFNNKPVLLEFDPATGKIKVNVLEASDDSYLEFIFSTSQGIFAMKNSQIYQYSFTNNNWELKGDLDGSASYDPSALRMFSQSDKLYSTTYEGGTMILRTLNAPYTSVSSTASLVYPHDYGYKDYNSYNSYYGYENYPFAADGKLYIPNGRNFYECDLSSNKVSSVTLPDETNMEYMLCVIGSKLYYVSSSTLYEITF
ncbi:OmpH family outer membrane protein [Bacteroides helcogenes]|uniref:DUF4595 domain-containing protein n=1 Tax=Bacteroides helcogenes (strain ATCC 35417 / DSM 20613 / JCM 6297 / CCUG 15421 / P 36-108) TaxID=693979 RepID=E6SQ49_BACT6|nr:OmpH family outer membrane protein [Bacteroides helcogenes]ADV42954.1 hypothetical protein Bache_0939 [Bacteroides helcogenes P 36-108]MDY5237003.1 OmpH family outer membrane protein [Bacteroides helcogenes]